MYSIGYIKKILTLFYKNVFTYSFSNSISNIEVVNLCLSYKLEHGENS